MQEDTGPSNPLITNEVWWCRILFAVCRTITADLVLHQFEKSHFFRWSIFSVKSQECCSTQQQHFRYYFEIGSLRLMEVVGFFYCPVFFLLYHPLKGTKLLNAFEKNFKGRTSSLQRALMQKIKHFTWWTVNSSIGSHHFLKGWMPRKSNEDKFIRPFKMSVSSI